MRRFSLLATLAVVLVGGFLLVRCGQESSGGLQADPFFTSFCYQNVTGKTEPRCADDSKCPAATGLCKKFNQNYCEKETCATCTSSANCTESGYQCDEGYCHKRCGSDSECPTAIAALCTKPPEAQFFNECPNPKDLPQGGCPTGMDCVNLRCHKKCAAAGDCENSSLFCLTGYCQVSGFCVANGYCRQCSADSNCPVNQKCDHGFCANTCTADSGCTAKEEFCVSGGCRKPQSRTVSFTNSRKDSIDIFPDQVKLHGDNDACAFNRWSWNVKVNDQWTVTTSKITLKMNETAILKVYFRPGDLGQFRAALTIPNTGPKLKDGSPYILVPVCGQALEAPCETGDKCAVCQCKNPLSSLAEEKLYLDLVGKTPTCS